MNYVSKTFLYFAFTFLLFGVVTCFGYETINIRCKVYSLYGQREDKRLYPIQIIEGKTVKSICDQLKERYNLKVKEIIGLGKDKNRRIDERDCRNIQSAASQNICLSIVLE